MDTLLESLAGGFDQLALREAAGLGALRREALARSLEVGLPGPRAERWKYTSLRALERRAFAHAGAPVAIDPTLLASIPAPRLVFVNGRLVPALGDTAALPASVLPSRPSRCVPRPVWVLPRRPTTKPTRQPVPVPQGTGF